MNERGSIEIVVVGLIVSLVLLLAIPYVGGVSEQTTTNMQNFCVGTLTGGGALGADGTVKSGSKVFQSAVCGIGPTKQSEVPQMGL